MQPRSPHTLINVLIGKSILESLLVAVISVGFYLTVTNPSLRGSLDRADEQLIAGWAVDESAPSTRVALQLFIDGQFAATGHAAESRPDVHAAGRAEDDWHGFTFQPPALSPGEHEARVYAVHAARNGQRQTLQLIGTPMRFRASGASQ